MKTEKRTCSRCGCIFTTDLAIEFGKRAFAIYFEQEDKGTKHPPEKPILCYTCETAPHYCCQEKCNSPAALIRHTQFSGHHPFCDEHARQEPNFGDCSGAVWKEIPEHLRAPKILSAKKNAFVKVSGDVFVLPTFLRWLKKLTRNYSVVVCTGGGTQINTALKEAGFTLTEHGPLGRELKTFKERQIARDELERNQALFQDLLDMNHITVRLIIPVLDIDGVLCHVNGDTMIQTAYLGYDILFVTTIMNRTKKKKAQFAHLSKVHTRGFCIKK